MLPERHQRPEALRITLAVAGFGADELEVSVEDELSICGSAARQFKRTFALASGVEVRKAELRDNLLAIALERPHREKQVLKVRIASAD